MFTQTKETVRFEEFTHRGRVYGVEIKKHYSGALVWIGYRKKEHSDGVARGVYFEKIPAMTRAECDSFPKCVAEKGKMMLKELES